MATEGTQGEDRDGSAHRYDGMGPKYIKALYGFDAIDVVEAMDALYEAMYEGRRDKPLHGVTEEHMKKFMMENAWFMAKQDPSKGPEDQPYNPEGIAQYYYNNVLSGQ